MKPKKDDRPLFAQVLESYEGIQSVEDAEEWLKKNKVGVGKAMDFMNEVEISLAGHERKILGGMFQTMMPRFRNEDSCKDFIDWTRYKSL